MRRLASRCAEFGHQGRLVPRCKIPVSPLHTLSNTIQIQILIQIKIHIQIHTNMNSTTNSKRNSNTNSMLVLRYQSLLAYSVKLYVVCMQCQWYAVHTMQSQTKVFYLLWSASLTPTLFHFCCFSNVGACTMHIFLASLFVLKVFTCMACFVQGMVCLLVQFEAFACSSVTHMYQSVMSKIAVCNIQL